MDLFKFTKIESLSNIFFRFRTTLYLNLDKKYQINLDNRYYIISRHISNSEVPQS